MSAAPQDWSGRGMAAAVTTRMLLEKAIQQNSGGLEIRTQKGLRLYREIVRMTLKSDAEKTNNYSCEGVAG